MHVVVQLCPFSFFRSFPKTLKSVPEALPNTTALPTLSWLFPPRKQQVDPLFRECNSILEQLTELRDQVEAKRKGFFSALGCSVRWFASWLVFEVRSAIPIVSPAMSHTRALPRHRGPVVLWQTALPASLRPQLAFLLLPPPPLHFILAAKPTSSMSDATKALARLVQDKRYAVQEEGKVGVRSG